MKMQQAQKVSKPDLLKTLKELEKISTRRIPLQEKVEMMNLEMLRVLKNESH